MKKTLIWIFSVLLTLTTAVWQRKTGPTYPKKIETSITGMDYIIQLPRTHGGEDDLIIDLEIGDPSISGILVYRRYPTVDPWDTVTFTRKDELLTASLPNQPPAGKLEYKIILTNKDSRYELPQEEPVIARFKGSVPAFVLIPHILFVFAAMLLSSIAGLYAIFNLDRYKFYGFLTACFLVVGGFILGPVIQKYAFGAFWTGFPFGQDLTDNKVLFAFIVWLVAIAGNYKKDRKYLTIIAAAFYLVITIIPHSMFGSELDYESGQVVTGFVGLF